MPTNMTEANRLNDLLKWEHDDALFSRETVLLDGSKTYAMGTVLGKATVGTCPTTGTADDGNTGKGTCASVTAGQKVQVGTYTIKCVKVVAGAGDFEVIAPDGRLVGIATVGVAFTNPHINFTLADGDPDFALGDKFTVAIPDGSEKFAPLKTDAIDGTQNAAGVLIYTPTIQPTTEKSVAFTSGGTYQIRPGDTVKGATSGATAVVVSLSISSGAWGSGTAAGTLVLDQQVGTFQAENLNVGANANVATIAGNSSAYAPDANGTAILNDAVLNPDALVWPAGITDAQKEAALAQLRKLNIKTRTLV